MRRACALLAHTTLLVLVVASSAFSAEWQLKPFLGVTYGGTATYNFVPQPSNRAGFAYGVTGLFLGEIFGVEGEFGHTPGFFQNPNDPLQLISDSGVTTATGNIVVAMPRHLAQYSLRPYLVGGTGVVHVAIDYRANVPTSSTLKTMDLGAGVTGFLTKHLGVTWDVRYFRSIDRTIETGLSVGSEHLSFWRASMALAIRI